MCAKSFRSKFAPGALIVAAAASCFAGTHPRLVYDAAQLAALRKNPQRVSEAAQAAAPYLSKTRTASWPDYSIPLPAAPMPARHPATNWPYWTALSAELRMELDALAYGCAMTGDRRLLDRARTMMLGIAQWERWTDIDSCSNGKDPCLDTYLITFGMSIAYDYLYPHLKAADRRAISNAIAEKGLRPIASRAGAEDSFVSSPQRWPNGCAMVSAALGLGALAVRGEHPEAGKHLDLAVRLSRRFLDEFGNADGGLVEGFYYGAASMEPLALFFSALKRETGADLFAHPYFRRAHEFPLYFTIPGKNWLAGFGDSGGPQGSQPLMIGIFRRMELSGGAQYYLRQALSAEYVDPLYLEAIQRWLFYALRFQNSYAVQPEISAAKPPTALAKEFKSIGWVALRSGWNPTDTLLAFRSGPSVGHSHLDQNSFIVAARGDVLASDPGYQRFDMHYPDGRDCELTRLEHVFTRGSLGHNVILVDGEGQKKADGALRGFFNSPNMAGATGEAANAYAGLRKFTRHVLHVRPLGLYMVLDQIRTDGRRRSIEWLLQTQPKGRFEIEGDGAIRAIVGESAMTATTLLPTGSAWRLKRHGREEKFGRTAAVSVDASEATFLTVLETHSAAERTRVRMSAWPAGGGNILLQVGREQILIHPADLSQSRIVTGEKFRPARIMIDRQIELLGGFDSDPKDVNGWRPLRITTPAQWQRRRNEIRQRVIDVMGKFPSRAVPLDARTLSEEDTPGYTRRKVSYLSADGDRIPAWLLIPKRGTKPWPAVLALHQTEAIGKDSAVGIGGAPHVRYGHELAERGFVVLAPDSITAGERVYPGSKPYVTEVFDRAHPEWSALGKMCSDHQRGIDYLETLDFVNARRIGVIGHSLGAYNSFFLAAFDERIAAAVSSCGLSTFGMTAKSLAWARESWFVHLPRLKAYLRAGIVPFDMHEVMALVAPRPLFNYSARQDEIFPDIGAIEAAGAQVGSVYRLLGADGKLVFRVGEGPHDFPVPVREQTYRWLAEHLR
ncbi:MAG: heparinase II/III family protein [Acidobacteriales bacterium]|nr:heparinase II/III family protein [Terriglobales bacterium]